MKVVCPTKKCGKRFLVHPPYFKGWGLRKAKEAGLNTVISERRDFILNGVNLADNVVDYALLFNVLHAENPIKILQEAYRVLSPLGKVGVVHWNYDPTTPRGPSIGSRPRPASLQILRRRDARNVASV